MVEALIVYHAMLGGLYVLTRKTDPQPETDVALLVMFFGIWFAALTGSITQ